MCIEGAFKAYRSAPPAQRTTTTTHQTPILFLFFHCIRTTAPRLLLATSSVTGACRQVNNAKSKTVCLRRLRSTKCISTRGSVTCILQRWQSILRRCQYFQSSPGEGVFRPQGPLSPGLPCPALPFPSAQTEQSRNFLLLFSFSTE